MAVLMIRSAQNLLLAGQIVQLPPHSLLVEFLRVPVMMRIGAVVFIAHFSASPHKSDSHTTYGPGSSGTGT